MLSKLENLALVQWVTSNEQLVFWLAITSGAVFIVSLLLIPWLIIRIPPDYFSEPERHRSALFGNHPLAAIALKMVRNTIAVVFVALGILLLVLPGQGLLAIFLGIFISDFPGKHRVINWIVAKKSVMKSINWMRKKAGKDPITINQ